MIRLLTHSSIRLHDEDLRIELDSAEIAPIFELDDTSVRFNTPSTQSHNETAIVQPESPTAAVVDEYPVFESPDDVGAGISPSPSVKARNSKTGQADGHSETGGTTTERNIPPDILIPHSNHRMSIRVDTDHGHHISINSQHPPSYAPPDIFSQHISQPHRASLVMNEERPGSGTASSINTITSTKRIIEDIAQRRMRTASRERYPGRLQPSMLPNLEILTLTDVPSTTQRQNLVDSLTTFIHECAEEEELAALEDMELHEKNSLHQRQSIHNGQFKLRCLVLEMSPAPDPIMPIHSPRGKRYSFTKSTTEDRDSEMFMEASESDFSFFREDDGGLLVSEGKIDTPTMTDGGMIYMGSPTADGHPVDVISELASFRRARRMIYEASIRVGRPKLDTALLGHWKGEIRVVKDLSAA